ncbi:hypothetical protein [Paenibacillus tengchongensis]|uniref:hypothetical protein n=1 Tax=Paenibacillus tengchongensis TaxID=2608684 RepID=UPI00124C6717|nr:hypothetical protein [Paenibacillus tengchongensis]
MILTMDKAKAAEVTIGLKMACVFFMSRALEHRSTGEQEREANCLNVAQSTQEAVAVISECFGAVFENPEYDGSIRHMEHKLQLHI